MLSSISIPSKSSHQSQDERHEALTDQTRLLQQIQQNQQEHDHTMMASNPSQSPPSLSDLLVEFLNGFQTKTTLSNPSNNFSPTKSLNFDQADSSTSSSLSALDVNTASNNNKKDGSNLLSSDLDALAAELISSLSRDVQRTNSQSTCTKTPSTANVKSEPEENERKVGSSHQGDSDEQQRSSPPQQPQNNGFTNWLDLMQKCQGDVATQQQQQQPKPQTVTSPNKSDVPMTQSDPSFPSIDSLISLLSSSYSSSQSSSTSSLSSYIEPAFLSGIINSLQTQLESMTSTSSLPPLYSMPTLQLTPSISEESLKHSLCSSISTSPSSPSSSISSISSTLSAPQTSLIQNSFQSQSSNPSQQSSPVSGIPLNDSASSGLSPQHLISSEIAAQLLKASSSSLIPFAIPGGVSNSQPFASMTSSSPNNPILSFLMTIMSLPKENFPLGASIASEVCSALASGDIKRTESLLSSLVTYVLNQMSNEQHGVRHPRQPDDFCSGITATQRLVNQMIESPTSTFFKRLPQPTLRGNITVQRGVFFNAKQNVFIAHWYENRRQLKKSFTVSRYGLEKAKRLAIEFRELKEREFRISQHQPGPGDSPGLRFANPKPMGEANQKS